MLRVFYLLPITALVCGAGPNVDITPLTSKELIQIHRYLDPTTQPVAATEADYCAALLAGIQLVIADKAIVCYIPDPW
jgi:hypothetical protein